MTETDASIRRPALIVVDMQNDFLRRGAPLEVPRGGECIAPIAALSAGFRQRSFPVVFTRFLAGPAEAHWWERWSPPCAAEDRACWPGVFRTYADTHAPLEGAAIIDELAPDLGDVVIDKFHYDAFFRTPLADVLNAQGCDAIVVVGVVTEGCVADTVRGAFCHRIPAAVVTDAVAPYADDLQEPALRNIETTYGSLIEAPRALADLEDQVATLRWW